MCAQQNLRLLWLLSVNPLLTESEARRELGLPSSAPDREDAPVSPEVSPVQDDPAATPELASHVPDTP